MKLSLVVTGVGMLTPVGLNALVSFNSVRSDITRLSMQRYADGTRQWITGGNIMKWTWEKGTDRLRVLGEMAIKEASSQARADGDLSQLGPTALLLGKPERVRPGYAFPPEGFGLAEWLSSLEIATVGPCEVVEAGHCNAQVALEKAGQFIGSGEAKSCIIGAVDTQIQHRVISWHEDNYRLKCSYMNDGLMPGEAACFLVVEEEQTARSRGAGILARILSVAKDREMATVLSDRPNTANALTNAVKSAITDAQISPGKISAIWCDLNGESYRAREWAFTEVRLHFQDHTELIHPADCYGDIGAVSDACLLALAVQAEASGWADAKPLLVFSGSEGGFRAASVIGPTQDLKMPDGIFPVSKGMPHILPVAFDLPELGPDAVEYEETEDPPRYYFEWELRQEHLDELASIYYQRQGLLSDPEVEWFRSREAEQRLLNHVDAIIAGGPSSVWAVASGILSDDEGACFAGAFTLGVLAGPKFLKLIEKILDDSPATKLMGIREGLKHAPAPHLELATQVSTWIRQNNVEIQALAASLAGYRRGGEPSLLLPLVQRDEPVLIRAAAEALMRLRYTNAIPLMESILTHDDPLVQQTIILSLLCLNSKVAREYCRRLCNGSPPAGVKIPVLLALCGNLSDFYRLTDGKTLDQIDQEVVEAIGILGNVKAIPLLISILDYKDDALKLSAAKALELLTGAGLREQAVAVEVLEAFEEGEPEEVRHKVERISTSANQWSQWWDQKKRHFSSRHRWRRGKPFNLGVCIEELRDGRSDYLDRQRAYWELVIQSRQDIPFEPDWFVPKQYDAIGKWQLWWDRKKQ